MASQPPGARQLIGLGASIVGSIVLGLVLGLVFDAWFGTSPLLVIIGLAVGIVCAVGCMVVGFRKFLKS